MKETKAERIFRKKFYGAIRHIEACGFDNFDAWNTLYTSDDEYICRRTVNAVLALCDGKEREVDWCIRHGFETWKDEAIMRKALSVVRNTCLNWIENEKKFAAI